MDFENENNGAYHKWQTSVKQWSKVKQLAREMRKEPTDAENILWQELRGHKLNRLKFRRQHSIDKFVVDFHCREKKLSIEVDGEIHDFQKENDSIRQKFLEELGYSVLRFKNEEIINDLKKVLEKIRSSVNSFLNVGNNHPVYPPPKAKEEIQKIF